MTLKHNSVHSTASSSPSQQREECSMGTTLIVSWNLVALRRDPHWPVLEPPLSWQLTSQASYMGKLHGKTSRFSWESHSLWHWASLKGKIRVSLWQSSQQLKMKFIQPLWCPENASRERFILKEEHDMPQVKRGRGGYVSSVMENSIVPKTHTYKNHWKNWSTFSTKP